jgi:hypothetical protein
MASPPVKSSHTLPRKPTGKTPPPDLKKPDQPGPSGDSADKKPSGRSMSRKPRKSRSPSRRRGSHHHDADRPRERVVERVIRESSSTGTWPQLTKTNYNEWSLRMRLKLQARDLWDVIEFGDDDYRDDRSALDAICSVVPTEMIPTLTVKDSTSEAWEAIKTLCIGDERRRAVMAQTLRMKYENIKLRDSELIEDFALRFSGVLQLLGDLGDAEPEEKAVKKYLRVVRARYKHLVVSMEAFTNLSKLSIEEITGTLKSSDDADEDATPPPSTSLGKLLLTHEEWLAKYKAQDVARGSSNAVEKFQKNRRGKGTGGGGGGRGEAREPNKPPSTPCFKCHKVGHWARYCPNSKPKKEQAHLAQGEEDEPTLLMVHAIAQVNPTPSSPQISSRAAAPPPLRYLDVQEPRLFAQLGPRADSEPYRWVLDTGATNHMTGDKSVFSELNHDVRGTVRFGDGSVAKIEGSGTIIFSCKNGEHRVLTGVY